MTKEVERREKKPVGPRAEDWAEGPVLTSGLIGAFVVAAVYVFVMPAFATTRFGRVLVDSAWVGKTIFTLGFWGLTLLIFKWRNQEQLRKLLHQDLLPTTWSRSITPANATLFIRLIQCHCQEHAIHPLTRRLVQGLAALENGQSRSEIQQLLRNQSDVDAERLEGSYSLIRTFIWSAPILGFIGTVLGIGSAIGGFSASMGAADDLTAVKSSLGEVIKGLAFSFQATFVGLVTSLVLVFATNLRHKAETRDLADMNDYCERQFLSRVMVPISEGAEEPGSEPPTGHRVKV